MSYHSSDSSYHGDWSQAHSGQSSASHPPGVFPYASRSRQTHQQPNTEGSYHYQASDSRYPQYAAHRNPIIPGHPYVQSTAVLNSTYSTSQQTGGYALYHPASYTQPPLQYDHRSQEWSSAQQRPAVSGNQTMMHSSMVPSPSTYSAPSLPLVTSKEGVGANLDYTSSNSWPNEAHAMSSSSNVQHLASARSTSSGAEYSVPCPYGCGTVLTGVHAVGNMTRHLKSQNCVGSGKDKTKYVCPVQGCDKRYIRSDGLKVHLRKRHNISQGSERTGSSEYDENEY